MSASATSTDALVLMLSSESARRGAFAISLDVNLRLTLLTPYPLGLPCAGARLSSSCLFFHPDLALN